jgi:hypothetical protein
MMMETPNSLVLKDILTSLDNEINAIMELLGSGKHFSRDDYQKKITELLAQVSKCADQNRDLCADTLTVITKKLVEIESVMMNAYTELQQVNNATPAQASKVYRGSNR